MSKENKRKINFSRLLMSEPGLIALILVILFALLAQVDDGPTTMSMRVFLVIYGYILLSLPITIISRYLQAKMSHLNMSALLALPSDDSRISFFKCYQQHNTNKVYVTPKTYTPYNSPAEPMTQVQLQVQSGTQLIHTKKAQTIMYQRPDKTIYFDSNRYDSFSLIGYEWDGSVYNTVSSSTSTTNGKEKTNGHMAAMTAGAVIGSIASPAGAIVGAAIGSGGKRKKNITSTTQNNTIQRQVEVSTPATLTFINNRTGQQFGIVIQCNSLVDSSIKCFSFAEPKPIASVEEKAPSPIPPTTTTTIDNVPDKYEELKKLKELYDMGIVTSDEFEAKKKQLLNL